MLLATGAAALVGCGSGPHPVPIDPMAATTATAKVELESAAVPDCCKRDAASVVAAKDSGAVLAKVALPDVRLDDQEGRPVRFVSELVGRRVVAVEFVFTRCTTTCPVLGLQFQRVQRLLGDQLGSEFALISLSVHPQFDTPAMLKSWGERYEATPGWTLATGAKPEMDRLLKALDGFSADRANHRNTILLIDGATGEAIRVDGTAAPGAIVKVMRSLRENPARPAEPRDAKPDSAAAPDDGPTRDYFTDARLVDQDGATHRFYSDMLRGKTVIISTFFSSCTGVCVTTASTLTKLQERLGDRLGRDVVILSISVDRTNDTPAVLANYARKVGAKPGWYFLTGERDMLDPVLKKLGQYVEVREGHSPIFLVGNLRTGLWKKVFGLGESGEVIQVIESVIGDGKAG